MAMVKAESSGSDGSALGVCPHCGGTYLEYGGKGTWFYKVMCWSCGAELLTSNPERWLREIVPGCARMHRLSEDECARQLLGSQEEFLTRYRELDPSGYRVLFSGFVWPEGA